MWGEHRKGLGVTCITILLPYMASPFHFYDKNPLSLFLIGSMLLSVRVQRHEADVSCHATQTLVHSLANLDLLWTNSVQYSIICTDNRLHHKMFIIASGTTSAARCFTAQWVISIFYVICCICTDSGKCMWFVKLLCLLLSRPSPDRSWRSISAACRNQGSLGCQCQAEFPGSAYSAPE